MAPSSPKVSAPSSASTLPTSHTTSATPRSPPDWRSTAPGTVKMPEPMVVPTTMRTRSRSVRTRASSRVVRAALELAGNGLRHLAGGRLPADVGRAHTRGESLRHGALEVAGCLGVPQLLEHQRAGEYRRHRIRDALACERRRRAMYRLEQSGPTRVQVRARGESETADQTGTEVGQDIAIEVVGDDHLKPLGRAHHLHGERIDVPVFRFDPGELGGDPFEGLLPDPVRRHRVRLVAHGHPSLVMRLRPLKRRPDDPFNALRRVDLLGDVLVAVDPAAAEVDAFGVLAKD